MITVRRSLVVLVAVLMVSSCGGSTEPAVSSSQSLPPASSAAPSGPPVGPSAPTGSDLLDEQLAKTIADLTPEQLASLCEGFAEDPDAVAEAFARPLDATGVPREDSVRAILKALARECSV